MSRRTPSLACIRALPPKTDQVRTLQALAHILSFLDTNFNLSLLSDLNARALWFALAKSTVSALSAIPVFHPQASVGNLLIFLACLLETTKTKSEKARMLCLRAGCRQRQRSRSLSSSRTGARPGSRPADTKHWREPASRLPVSLFARDREDVRSQGDTRRTERSGDERWPKHHR